MSSCTKLLTKEGTVTEFEEKLLQALEDIRVELSVIGEALTAISIKERAK